MKVIDYKKVNMTDAEFSYYKQLVNKFTEKENNVSGEYFFKDTFNTDSDGNIILIKTEKSVPWAVLFFLQQLMINQRMRMNDKLIEKNVRLLEQLEDLKARFDNQESNNG